MSINATPSFMAQANTAMREQDYEKAIDLY